MFWLKGPSRSAAFSAPRAPPSLACVYSLRPPMGDLDERDPQGVSQGGPREGPQSAILLCNVIILEVILVPLWGANLHTVIQKAPKWGSKKLSKPALLGGCFGELGCLLFLLGVFKTNLPLKHQSPKLPKHPPRRAGFDHF